MSGALTLALAGNPNAGKTSIFNALTGSQQHVGNWPGKTVERKAGTAQIGGREITVEKPGDEFAPRPTSRRRPPQSWPTRRLLRQPSQNSVQRLTRPHRS